jgi:hypothetical protein
MSAAPGRRLSRGREGEGVMKTPRIETVDSANWYAVLFIGQGGIECIGFKRRRQRDRWLSWYEGSIRQFFRSLPLHF